MSFGGSATGSSVETSPNRLDRLSALNGFPPFNRRERRKRRDFGVFIAFRVSSRFRPEPYHDHGTTASVSPLPFGVHRVSDHWIILFSFMWWMSLHCLSAFTAFPTQFVYDNNVLLSRVFIAFRRSPRFRPRMNGHANGQPKVRLHCLSAFTAFPTTCLAKRHRSDTTGLHCLSAFTAFPTLSPR